MEISDIKQALIPLVQRIQQVEREIAMMKTSVLQSGTSSASVAQLADDSQQHPFGMCENIDCAICGAAKAALYQAAVQVTRRDVFAKLGQAAEDLDLVDEGDKLSLRFSEIEAGAPMVGVAIRGTVIV